VHAGENTSDPPPPPSLRQQRAPCPALLYRLFVSAVELASFGKKPLSAQIACRNVPVQVLVAVTTPNKIISTSCVQGLYKAHRHDSLHLSPDDSRAKPFKFFRFFFFGKTERERERENES